MFEAPIHYTIKEAATRLNVSEQTLRRWDRSGKLPAERHPINNYRLYPAARVDALLDTGAPSLRGFPPSSDAFVGRSSALAALRGHLTAGARLVNVHGPPGMGKTRLVTHFAREGAHTFPACYFCDLSEASAPESAALAVIHGVERAALTADAAEALTALGRALVVLDNFEDVVEHANATVGRWLGAAPEITFVVTSRRRLNLAAEVLLPLGGLELDAEAVDLFEARARRHGTASPDPPEDIRALVATLDGIPLAIELAAARSALLSASALNARVIESSAVLRSDRRDVAPHKRSLDAALASAVDALDASTRAAFVQCCVLTGDFDVEAAEAILATADQRWSDPLDTLTALLDASMLTVTTDEGDPTRRLSVLPTLRRFGARLDAPGVEAARQRMTRHYLARGRAWADALLKAPGEDVLDAIDAERHHLWRLADSEDPQIAMEALLALEPLYFTRGPYLAITDQLIAALAALPVDADRTLRARALEAIARMHRQNRALEASAEASSAALALDPPPALRGQILMTRAVTCAQRGDAEGAERCATLALALLEGTPYARLETMARGCLGSIYHNRDALDEAIAHFEAVVALAQATGDAEALGEATGCLANIAHDRLEFDRAGTLYRKALALFRAQGHAPLEAIFLGYLGCLNIDLGQLERAIGQLTEARDAAAAVGLGRFEGLFGAALGAALAMTADGEEAAIETFDRAAGVLERVGDPSLLWCLSVHRGHLELMAGRKGEVDRRLSAPLERDTDDARFARRVLERALEGSGGAWRVARDGGAFTTPAGHKEELRARGSLRAILAALVAHREQHPGQPLGRDAICEAGWPGQRLIEEAAAGRVRDAIWQLRRLGLRPVLLTDAEGYLLDPRALMGFDDL